MSIRRKCSGFLLNVLFKVDQNEPYMEACNRNSVRNWFNCLVQFKRIGCVVKKDHIKGKITEQGFPVIMVGYAANSATGTYQMYNPYTKRVIKPM